MFFLCLAEFAINLARGLFTLSLGYILYTKTQSVWAFAFTFSSEFFITLLLQAYAGACVDRFGAKKILLFATIGSTIAMFAIVLTSSLISISSSLIVAAIILNSFKPFIRNGVFVITPQIAPSDLITKLNSYITVSLQCGQLMGMALTGLIIEFGGVDFIPHIISFCFFVAVSCYFLTKPLNLNAESDLPLEKDPNWSTVLNYLKESPAIIFSLVIVPLDFLAIAMFNIILAPAIEHRFDGDALWLTYIDSFFAVGAICSGLLMSKIELKKWTGLHLTSATMFSSIFLLLSYTTDSLSNYTLVGSFIFGFLSTRSVVYWLTKQQKLMPATIKGKLGSLRSISIGILVSVGSFLLSMVLDMGFNKGIYFASAFLIFVLCLISLIKLKMSKVFG